jgi:16S rRNA G966 N2-methylase RsmD
MKDIDYNGFNNIKKFYNGIENIPVDVLKLIRNDVWKCFTKEERELVLPTIEKYWNDFGFPYPEFNIDKIKEDYERMLNFDSDSIFLKKEKEITLNNIGLGTVNSVHPHKYNVKSSNNYFATPYENFIDKNIFKKVILKAIEIYGTPFYKTGIRMTLSIYGAARAVSNFRPTVANFIYKKYCPPGGRVLDPSLGYSGRLFGALTSNISYYEGCDPCSETFIGNKKLLSIIQNIENKNNKLNSFFEDAPSNRIPEVILHNVPFEDFQPKSNFFDLVFTSPPYFDKELYSKEETQSYKRYPKYNEWLDKFLKPMIVKSHDSLKKNGYMIINIYGKVKENCLEYDFNKIAKDVFGHEADDTIYLRLSKMIGTKNKGNIENRNNRQDYKIEPIFIYKKT